MKYYKIVAIKYNQGTIVDTSNNIDYLRIKRFNELKKLFQLIFDFSEKFNISIYNILIQIFNKSQELQEEFELNKIKSEVINTGFICQREFKYFNDFILDKIRNEDKINRYPDRFKSHYFFKTIEDCFRYSTNLGIYKNIKIIEVEFLETISIFEGDNQLLTNFNDDFTSKDFYFQAKDFLIQKKTNNSLIEVVFVGKYKVLKYYTFRNVLKKDNFFRKITSYFF